MSSEQATENRPSIGVVWMERNRTIIVRLSAQTPDGAIAEANLEYKRRSPKYESVLRYLGGMTPGEARPVYEWDFGLGTNA